MVYYLITLGYIIKKLSVVLEKKSIYILKGRNICIHIHIHRINKRRWQMGDAGLVSGVSHSLRISIWRSFTLLMHCLTDSSLHTSSGSNVNVLPYASPAASTSLSFFFRSRMVAMTDREGQKSVKCYSSLLVMWVYSLQTEPI